MLASVKNRDVPPEEMNGSVMPLVGTSASTTLMLKNAWIRIVAVMPKARKRAKGSFDRQRGTQPAIRQHQEKRDDQQRADAVRAPLQYSRR